MLDLPQAEREKLKRAVVAPLRETLHTDTAMMNYIVGQHQQEAAVDGFHLPADESGRVALEFSICHHVAEMNFPLIVDDAIAHPLLRGHRSVRELGVGAYLGAPVHSADGRAIGTVCVMQLKPRRWTDSEVERVIATAQAVDGLLARWGMCH